MTSQEENLILSALHILGHEFHENSRNHGFWLKDANGNIDTSLRNKGEMIALMHSELSEALEGIRNNITQDIHCPEFTSEEIELADACIRIIEYCEAFKLRIGEAILSKHKYNLTRPYKHNKEF